MNENHTIVVSAENNHYMAWQCKLFHYSCFTHLGMNAIFMVHDSRLGRKELYPDYQDIIAVGGRVQRAPSYAFTPLGKLYVPRNGAGSLLHMPEECYEPGRFIFYCDADMIFARPFPFPEGFGLEYCDFITFEPYREYLDPLRKWLKLDLVTELPKPAVPYCFPAECSRRLGEHWLWQMDALPLDHWDDGMYTFTLAWVKLGFPYTDEYYMHVMQSNHINQALIARRLLHYGYGDDFWDKKHYCAESKIGLVWEPTIYPNPKTVIGEVIKQIREAKVWYTERLQPMKKL